MELYSNQVDALRKMHNGCILNGDVGSGKSRTALAYYYFVVCKGKTKLIETNYNKKDASTKDKILLKSYEAPKRIKKLYIITTPKKRNEKDWESEMVPFPFDVCGIEVNVDSWNNIKKYTSVVDSFFIFDEQRVVGYGAWSKSFIKICKSNEWILLSATPGDKWEDYIPVFIANGFYKNKTEFAHNHIIYSRYITKYPKVDGYTNEGKLQKLRSMILVDMPIERKTIQHHEYISCKYDRVKYKEAMSNRWNPFTNEPIQQISELCYILRRICNLDESRIDEVIRIVNVNLRTIIFYNFDYELEELRKLGAICDIDIFEYNGHKHDPTPTNGSWVYLVQYTAGAEGWNSTDTNCVIFYSQNYSYKTMKQAEGRIDRLNTSYVDLYYYHLKSASSIDNAIYKALKTKKNFNETKFIG